MDLCLWLFTSMQGLLASKYTWYYLQLWLKKKSKLNKYIIKRNKDGDSICPLEMGLPFSRVAEHKIVGTAQLIFSFTLAWISVMSSTQITRWKWEQSHLPLAKALGELRKISGPVHSLKYYCLCCSNCPTLLKCSWHNACGQPVPFASVLCVVIRLNKILTRYKINANFNLTMLPLL